MDAISSNDKVKLTELCDSGVEILQQVADLKEGLSETVKALAAELSVKPAVLNKMLRLAFKANLAEEREGLDEVELLLEAAGR